MKHQKYLKHLDLATDIICRATTAIEIQTQNGVISRIADGMPETPVSITKHLKQHRPGCQILTVTVKNTSQEPLLLRQIVPLSVDVETGGFLELDSPPGAWTICGMASTVTDTGGVYDLNFWRVEALKHDFSLADYAVIGNRRTKKYLTLGFLKFDRHGILKLNFDETTYNFNYLHAICKFDTMPLKPGEEVESEPLYINVADAPSAALDEYTNLALQYAESSRLSFEVPTGWSPWDYYLRDVTEKDVIENTQWLAKHKNLLPVKYIQLDHGYQPCEGDWLETNAKFPHGLKWLAEQIQQLGFVPALWLCPFLIAEASRVYKEHPEWAIKDRAGRPVPVMGYAVKQVYTLDCSIPEARNWLFQLGKTVREYGFKYIKLDGANAQPMATAGVLADPSISKIQAMRLGLQALRAGLGEDAYILNASLFGASLGIADAMRVSGDAGARWDAKSLDKHYGERDRYPGPGYIRRCINSAMNFNFLHRRWWCNDPDYLVVRPAGDRSELSFPETVTWASVVGLTNGSLILGDRLARLPKEQIEILSKVLPPYSAGSQTVDFFENAYPAFLKLKVANQAEAWHVVGVINANPMARRRDYSLDFKKLGLSEKNSYHLFDFWSKEYLGAHHNHFEIQSLPPGHCRVIGIRAAQNFPQVVGTDWHITQGGVEFDSVSYDPQDHSMVCSGIRIKRPGYLFVYLPEKFRSLSAGDIDQRGIRRLLINPTRESELKLSL